MIRPLHAADQAAIAPLLEAAAPALRLVDPSAALASWRDRPSGDAEHLLGSFEDGTLTAVIRVVPAQRFRLRHSARLDLISAPGASLAPLLSTTTGWVDDWSPLDRLELALPADHPALSELAALGFEVEVRHLGRLPDGGDELVLGRLRPGFQPRPPGPPPAWPSRREGPALPVTIRPIEEADTPGVTALSTAPSTVWGTLQTASSNDLFFARRFHATPPGNLILVVQVGDAIAGIGGLHPTAWPGVRVLGMGFHPDWQGRGLGRLLMLRQIQESMALGARRLELEVWEDNTRARALYTQSGFVPEGLRRYDGIRAGGHASSLSMALTLSPAATADGVSR